MRPKYKINKLSPNNPARIKSGVPYSEFKTPTSKSEIPAVNV